MWEWRNNKIKASNVCNYMTIISRDVNEARGGLVLEVSRVRSKKKNVEKKRSRQNPPHPEHHERRSSPADATISRRRGAKHVPPFSQYSPASIDTGFVEFGLVQLSQSVKTTNSMSHTRTHIPTDKLNNGTLYEPRYEDFFLPKGKNGLGHCRPCLITNTTHGMKYLHVM